MTVAISRLLLFHLEQAHGREMANCSVCPKDTAGQHAFDCPCNPLVRWRGPPLRGEFVTAATTAWSMALEPFVQLPDGQLRRIEND